jgi:penicillin-binding protein 1A
VKKLEQVLPYVVWSLAAAFLVFCLGSLHLFATQLDDLSRHIELDRAPEASLVYDRHHNLLLTFASEDRTYIRLDQMSSALVAAVVVAEDRHFYRHAGMDLIALARAAWVNIKARGIRQGASTITQQLVRQIALSPEKNLARKMREALLALRVERRFDKAEILEAYLNRIYLGSGHYGAEAAARGYFGKPASELTPAESALLAALIPCPTACSPRGTPAVATSRRNYVLGAMKAAGVLSDEAYAEAIASPVSLVRERHDPYTTLQGGDHHDEVYGLHFIEAVRRQVMQQFGSDDVLRGGLRIYTTLDMKLQQYAEDAIRERAAQLDKTSRRGAQDPPLEGALVALDPRTGEVLALVGGRDFHLSPFNRATQALRQPGSAFKPLLFAAAIEQGYTPSSFVGDIDRPIQTAQGPWLPGGEHERSGYTLRQALTISSNRAAVRVMQLVGIGTTQRYAQRLGITSPLPAVPSLALGTGEVTLLDLTSAYGAFANKGIIAPPTLITRIEDRDGTIIWPRGLNRHAYRAIRPGTAYLLSTMMADVVNRGTATRARAEGFTLPAAGKTGTTDDYADAWFIGYTPNLVAGVWFGYDEKRTIMNRGFAGTVAVPAWARFMKNATAGHAADWFEMPSDVERIAICRKTGLRASGACRTAYSEDGRPNVYSDYYLLGTGPHDTCTSTHVEPEADPFADERARSLATTAPSAVF